MRVNNKGNFSKDHKWYVIGIYPIIGSNYFNIKYIHDIDLLDQKFAYWIRLHSLVFFYNQARLIVNM